MAWRDLRSPPSQRKPPRAALASPRAILLSDPTEGTQANLTSWIPLQS